MNKENFKIGVIGAGSWGTAIANLLAKKGYEVDLWVYEKEVAQQIRKLRENKEFLPGVKLSENITPINDIKKATKEKDFIIIVIPSQFVRKTAAIFSDYICDKSIIVSASKGIEYETGLTVSGILKEVFKNLDKSHFAVLSGPSFAKEVAQGNIPTSVTAAAENIEIAKRVQYLLSEPYFRVYTNNDIIGVELCGAVKNVIAIASGIIQDMKNTRAALITRGIAEIRRLGSKLGASPNTFIGLSGIGDLILTCTADLSRNYRVGERIGKGEKLKDIIASTSMIAEGVENTKSIYQLAKKLNVDMPICDAVYNILYKDMTTEDALKRVLARDLKDETY
jgi:glycerol-3-phosphate dehydrogenase (NAD(P)+)